MLQLRLKMQHRQMQHLTEQFKYAVIDNGALNTGAGAAFTATGSYVFVDTDLDGSFNYVVLLTDGVLGDIASTDIIA